MRQRASHQQQRRVSNVNVEHDDSRCWEEDFYLLFSQPPRLMPELPLSVTAPLAHSEAWRFIHWLSTSLSIFRSRELLRTIYVQAMRAPHSGGGWGGGKHFRLRKWCPLVLSIIFPTAKTYARIAAFGHRSIGPQ